MIAVSIMIVVEKIWDMFWKLILVFRYWLFGYWLFGYLVSGVFRTLSNILDGAFCEKPLAIKL